MKRCGPEPFIGASLTLRPEYIMPLKSIDHDEALEILDGLEQRNLLHAQSRVLADIVRDGKCGTPAPDEAARCGTYSACIEEADGNFHGYVWSFDGIMSYLRIAFMPQLAEVGL